MDRGKEGEREREERKGRKGERRKEGGHTRSFCDSSEEGLGSGRWHALHLAGIIARSRYHCTGFLLILVPGLDTPELHTEPGMS